MTEKRHIQTQSQWEAEMSIKIMDYVRDNLYLELRFLRAALWELEPMADERLTTFATDGRLLLFSTEQMLRLFQTNEKYLRRLYLHTVFHCLFQHLWIGGGREKRLWNLSCDIAVEYVIDGMKKLGISRILSLTRQRIYEEIERVETGISAAVIYGILLEKGEEEISVFQREFFTDDHRYWPKEEKKQAVPQEVRSRWGKIVRQTQLEQKRRGESPQEGETLMMAQMRAARGRRSYQEFLQKFAVFREELHCDSDEFDLNFYSYGLRLYENMPLIEPVESRESNKIQDFVIVVDTSYSTSGELIQGFLRETFDILSRQNSFFHCAKIRILQCDEKVRREDIVTDEKEWETFFTHYEVLGGGGTDFRPAFEYVNELLAQGAFDHLCGLLYFTDGKGIYPREKPEYKTAFLFLEEYEEEKVPAWAIRLQLEKEEFVERLGL